MAHNRTCQHCEGTGKRPLPDTAQEIMKVLLDNADWMSSKELREACPSTRNNWHIAHNLNTLLNEEMVEKKSEDIPRTDLKLVLFRATGKCRKK